VDRIQKYGGRSRLQSEINSNQNKGFGANILAQSKSEATWGGSSFRKYHS